MEDKKIDGRSREAIAIKAEKQKEDLRNTMMGTRPDNNAENTIDGQRPNINAAVVDVNRPTRKKTAESPDIQVAHHIPEGYVGYWVSDEKGKVEKRLDLGYIFLDDKYVVIGDATTNKSIRPSNAKTMLVDHDKDGNPIYGYLMIQRQEWHAEDKKIKRNMVDKTVQQLEENDKDAGRYGAGLQVK